MENYVAYLDESGAHGFDFTKEGTSKYFVVTAVIIDEAKVNEIEGKFLQIKSKYYPESELKSSKIKNDEQRRLAVLNDLQPLDFKFINLIVDKQAIYEDSYLKYKETFYKFLYGLMYSNLYKTYRSLSVVADRMISDNFVLGFQKYVETNHEADLFHQSLNFKDSKSATIIQIADVIAGTTNRFFSGTSTINLKTIFPDKILGETFWPSQYRTYTYEEEEIDDENSKIISDLALLRIQAYIRNNQNEPDPLIVKRRAFLNYLQSIFLYSNRRRFIYTDEIINHLEEVTGDKVKHQYFRQQIVAPLRTEGILISSNTNGYKIPCSTTDIYTFFNLFSKIINPMVGRLKISYEALYEASGGKFNVLDHPEYEYLKKLIN